MLATILSIGDEITLGQNLDTNSAWLSAELVARSIVTVEHRTVPDDRAAIAEAVTALAGRSDVLLITGGLGPTDDDLTRPALGDVLTPGRPLVVDAETEARLRRWFAGRDRPMPAANLSQALRPDSMQIIPNAHGTAPGLAGRLDGCDLYAMPGPPREVKPMFRDLVAPRLVADADRCVRTELVHLYGLGESDAAERLGELTGRDRATLVGTTASRGIVSARVRVEGTVEEAERELGRVVALIESAWAPYCFGRGDATLADAVGAVLRDQGIALATAESCTGGWLGKAIVDVAGASDYYRGGWVTYADEAKTAWLGVPAALIARAGAVSAPVASALAAEAVARSGADASLAVTGVAGPGGGGPDKPPGTVFVGLARRDRETPVVRRFRFRGERDLVRDRSVKSALQMLRLSLLGVDDGLPFIWQQMPTTEASA